MTEDQHSRENKEFTKQQNKAKSEIRSLRVNVAHIRLNLQCYEDLLFVAYNRVI
jgi:hypothetical protein